MHFLKVKFTFPSTEKQDLIDVVTMCSTGN